MNKTELRERLEKSYKLLVAELVSIRDEDWKRKLWENNPWTVHDIVSHIVGWDVESLKGAKELMRGKEPSFNNISEDRVNQISVKARRSDSRGQLMRELEKRRFAIGDFLKKVTNKHIDEANRASEYYYHNPVSGLENRITVQNILDQSWHDEEHIKHLRDFKRKALAIPLRYQISFHFNPKKPFCFDYSFYNPSHFKTADVQWNPEEKSQSMRFKGKFLGLKFCGSSDDKKKAGNSRVTLTVYSEKKLTKRFVASLKEELSWRYNLNYDLSNFYDKAKSNKVLSKLIQKYKGMRPFHPGSLYEYFIIGIVLQNAPVHRTVKMMQALFERYGRSVSFDGKCFYAFWEPNELLIEDDRKQELGDELRTLKLGYRADSIVELTELFVNGTIDEVKMRSLTKEDQREALLRLPGIGSATAEYILKDVFHRFSDLQKIPPWEQKLYSRIFFNSKKIVSEKKLLKYLNAEFGEYVKLAIYYFWQDIWWRRERGEKIKWLEDEIRL